MILKKILLLQEISGEYKTRLPDGRLQVVSYIANKYGFNPRITYVFDAETGPTEFNLTDFADRPPPPITRGPQAPLIPIPRPGLPPEGLPNSQKKLLPVPTPEKPIVPNKDEIRAQKQLELQLQLLQLQQLQRHIQEQLLQSSGLTREQKELLKNGLPGLAGDQGNGVNNGPPEGQAAAAPAPAPPPINNGLYQAPPQQLIQQGYQVPQPAYPPLTQPIQQVYQPPPQPVQQIYQPSQPVNQPPIQPVKQQQIYQPPPPQVYQALQPTYQQPQDLYQPPPQDLYQAPPAPTPVYIPPPEPKTYVAQNPGYQLNVEIQPSIKKEHQASHHQLSGAYGAPSTPIPAHSLYLPQNRKILQSQLQLTPTYKPPVANSRTDPNVSFNHRYR